MSTTADPPATTPPASTPTPGDGKESWWTLAVLLAIWLVAVVALIVWGVVAREKLHPEVNRTAVAGCPAVVAPTGGQKLATLTAQGQTNTAVVFRRDLHSQTRVLEYGIDDPSKLLTDVSCLEVEDGQFLRDSGDAELDPSRITATGTLEGRLLRVTVKFDRSADSLGQAGSYAGAISVVDPRVQRVDIPMTVTMAYPTWQFPLALFVALMLPAVVYLWLLKGSFRGNALTSEVHARRAAAYLISRNGLLAVATGGVAAFGTFTALYLTSPTWDGDPIRYIGLLTGVFSAFVAASTGVAAAGVDKAGS